MTSSVAGILECVDASSDLAGAQLGDVRRTRRAVQIAEAMARRPSGSIPQAIDSEADREGYYRFVGNKSVDWLSLLELHLEATATRACVLEKALVLHDTSEMSFPVRDGHMREHLAQCGGKTQGFSFHASLCCSADGTRAPLGLVSALRAGYHFTIRLSADRRVKSGPRYWADFEKLSEMMARLEPMGHRLVDLSPRSKERGPATQALSGAQKAQSSP